MKRCPKCGETKPYSAYAKASRRHDNTQTYCRECHKGVQRKSRFNITDEQYQAMVDDHEGVCAICARPPGPRGFHIDHDHRCCPQRGRSCGVCIRGLLCQSCNQGLGQFGDDARTLAAAIEYLSRPSRPDPIIPGWKMDEHTDKDHGGTT